MYTYFQAREKLSDILKESGKEEVVIRRRKGDLFSIVPKSPVLRSPFDVTGVQTQSGAALLHVHIEVYVHHLHIYFNMDQ